MSSLPPLFLLFSACVAPPVDTPVAAGEFESAATCGMCHTRQYDEWRQSMHAYAALSPVFDAMAAKAYRDSGAGVGTFCTRCHSVIGDDAGELGDTQADQRSELSREGVTCDVCHTATGHGIPLGNADLQHEPGSTKLGPYDLEGDPGHDGEMSDLLTSPELCGSCHDVFMFPGLRIEEAYTEYRDSPAASDGVRCQDCHMGPEPGVPAERPWGPSAEGAMGDYPDREQADHRFIGPDYSLLDDFPFSGEEGVAARADYLSRTQRLLENAVGIKSAACEQRLSPDGTVTITELIVVVESLIDSHNVPTGFTSERQLWLEITATNDSGEVVYSSGDLDVYGDLRDSHSHSVLDGEVDLDEDLFNLQSSNLVVQRTDGEGTSFEVEIFDTTFPFDASAIDKHSLEPLEQRTVSYDLPQHEGVSPQVAVALKYRNLPPYVLRELQLDELVERLQIFTLDSTTACE